MKFRSLGRASLALALPGLAALLTSCGGGHTIGYAYVQSSPSNTASTNFIYDVRSDNGALSPAVLTQVPAPTATNGAVASVVSPDHANLYVLYGAPTDPTTGLPVNNGVSQVVHYGIKEDTGTPTPLDTQNTGGTEAVGLAIDPAGHYLYAIDTFAPGFSSGAPGPGDVTVFAIQANSSGSSTSPGGTLTAPACDGVTGVTVPNGAGCYYQVGFGPRGVTQTPASSGVPAFVYVTNSGNTANSTSGTAYGTVSGFQMTSTTGTTGGALTSVDFGPPAVGSCTGTPFPGPTPTGAYPSLCVGITPWAVTSVISGAGSLPLVYISDYAQNAVYAFRVQNGATPGSLTNAGLGGAGSLAAYQVGNQPENLLVDPRSQFLYVSNFRDGTINAFNIVNGTGALTSVNGSPYPVGTGPLCMAIDPTEGKYFYVVNYISGSVSGFTLNGQTGQLASLPNTPFLIGSSSTAVNNSNPTCISLAANGSTPTPGTP